MTIFIPEGVPAPTKEIINQPELQVYVKVFGKNKGELSLVAEANNEIVDENDEEYIMICKL